MRILIVLMLFVFWGCSSKKTPMPTSASTSVIMMSVCKETAKNAKNAVSEQLMQKIPAELYLKIEFQAYQKEKENCYRAWISQENWSSYLQELKSLYDAQQLVLSEYNNSIVFSKKEQKIDDWLQKSKAYNNNLEILRKIQPISLHELDDNRTKLLDEINAFPSILMLYKPCARNTNYRCNVAFRSQVDDESQQLKFLWSFGDGSTSQKHQPLHMFTKSGEYTVSLKVTDPNEASGVSKVVVLVKPTSKPIARFKVSSEHYEVGEAVHFKNRSSVQIGKIQRYNWSYGDGTYSKKRDGKHYYKSAGHYVVRLKVCSQKKQCSSVKHTLQIIKPKNSIDVKKGSKIEDYIKSHGPAVEKSVKEGALMSAYLYDDIWLLVKRGKIVCAVRKQGLSNNLLGEPKKCYWHERHSSEFMVELK